jgi:SAM-dependent methyltransferase
MDLNKISYRQSELFNEFFKDKNVLDVASNTGESSFDISKLGAKKVIGIEPRIASVNTAIKSLEQLKYTNVEFVCGDATDYYLMDKLLVNINTVSCFGVFYHLTDHFKFLKKICTSECKYLLIETLFGLESPNPSMLCINEPTDNELMGINEGFPNLMCGAPNIAWIDQVLSIFNWQITYFMTSYLGDERMIIGATNKNFINLDHCEKMPDNFWKWDIDADSKIGNNKFSIY